MVSAGFRARTRPGTRLEGMIRAMAGTRLEGMITARAGIESGGGYGIMEVNLVFP